MRLVVILMLALAAAGARAGEAGTPPTLAPYAGRVVYLDFWASWCAPCAQSFPWLNEMQTKYRPRLAVVGVNVDTNAAAAQAFLKRNPARFDILADPQGDLAERYEIQGMPSAVILDARGRVLHQHSGFRTADKAEYETAIRKALDSLPAPEDAR